MMHRSQVCKSCKSGPRRGGAWQRPPHEADFATCKPDSVLRSRYFVLRRALSRGVDDSRPLMCIDRTFVQCIEMMHAKRERLDVARPSTDWPTMRRYNSSTLEAISRPTERPRVVRLSERFQLT